MDFLGRSKLRDDLGRRTDWEGNFVQADTDYSSIGSLARQVKAMLGMRIVVLPEDSDLQRLNAEVRDSLGALLAADATMRKRDSGLSSATGGGGQHSAAGLSRSWRVVHKSQMTHSELRRKETEDVAAADRNLLKSELVQARQGGMAPPVGGPLGPVSFLAGGGYDASGSGGDGLGLNIELNSHNQVRIDL